MAANIPFQRNSRQPNSKSRIGATNESNAACDYESEIDQKQRADRTDRDWPRPSSLAACQGRIAQGCITKGAKTADQKNGSLKNRVVHWHAINTVPVMAEHQNDGVRRDQKCDR